MPMTSATSLNNCELFWAKTKDGDLIKKLNKGT